MASCIRVLVKSRRTSHKIPIYTTYCIYMYLQSQNCLSDHILFPNSDLIVRSDYQYLTFSDLDLVGHYNKNRFLQQLKPSWKIFTTFRNHQVNITKKVSHKIFCDNLLCYCYKNFTKSLTFSSFPSHLDRTISTSYAQSQPPFLSTGDLKAQRISSLSALSIYLAYKPPSQHAVIGGGL